MPTAVTLRPWSLRSACRQADSVACQICSGSCSTQPGLREVLRELLVAAGHHRAGLVDDQRGDAGRAGVDGQHAHPAARADLAVARPTVEKVMLGPYWGI